MQKNMFLKLLAKRNNIMSFKKSYIYWLAANLLKD